MASSGAPRLPRLPSAAGTVAARTTMVSVSAKPNRRESTTNARSEGVGEQQPEDRQPEAEAQHHADQAG
jgi:hypothetical protein